MSEGTFSNWQFRFSDWPCTAHLTEDNGEFASPRWPQRYPSMSSCSYLITGPPLSQIYLRFNSIHLEAHIGSSCKTAYDKINIYDGNSSMTTLLETLCGNMQSYSLQSTTNTFYVEFITDSRVQLTGFHASYTFLYQTTTTYSTTTSTTSVRVGADFFENDVTTNETYGLAGTNYVNISNNTFSENLALHDTAGNIEILDASFIESTEFQDSQRNDSEMHNSGSDPGVTGD